MDTTLELYLEELPLSSSFPLVNIYPNPCVDILYINNLTTVPLDAFLYNGEGLLVGRYEIGEKYEIDVWDVPTGIYYLVVEAENGQRWVEKVVIGRWKI